MQKSVSCCSECGTNPVESSKRRGSSNWRGFHSSRVREKEVLRSASLYRFSAGVFEGRSHELHWPLCTADFVHVGQPSTLNKSRTVFHGVPRHSGPRLAAIAVVADATPYATTGSSCVICIRTIRFIS